MAASNKFSDAFVPDILTYLTAEEVIVFMQTCKDAKERGSFPFVWHNLYRRRWPAERNTDETGREKDDAQIELLAEPGIASPSRGLRTLHDYASRHQSPHVGDIVEVKWCGVFNLLKDGKMVTYEGNSWWEAAIMRKDERNFFLVHYTHWESTVWDEWVPRSRLRRRRNLPTSVEPQHLEVGDVVELLCPSDTGRRPWLECRVVALPDAEHADIGEAIRSPAVERNVPIKTLVKRKFTTADAAAERSPRGVLCNCSAMVAAAAATMGYESSCAIM